MHPACPNPWKPALPAPHVAPDADEHADPPPVDAETERGIPERPARHERTEPLIRVVVFDYPTLSFTTVPVGRRVLGWDTLYDTISEVLVDLLRPSQPRVRRRSLRCYGLTPLTGYGSTTQDLM